MVVVAVAVGADCQQIAAVVVVPQSIAAAVGLVAAGWVFAFFPRSVV